MMQALVFDLGGTHLRSATVDAAGGLRHVAKCRIGSTAIGVPAHRVWEAIIRAMCDAEERHNPELRSDAPIVVSFPGPVQQRRSVLAAPTLVGNSPTMPDLAGALERATGRRVFVLNDVSAAAWYCSSIVDAERLLVVTVSSGIGAKVFDARHPAGVFDDQVYAGELGHILVDHAADAPECDCGRRGHLGAIASGRGFERAARRRALSQPETFASSLLARRHSAQELSNEHHLVPAALEGDTWTLKVLAACTEPLGAAILTLVMGAGIERVLLIGGLAQALGSIYLDIIRVQLRELAAGGPLQGLTETLIGIAPPDEECCLRGCAMFALRNASASDYAGGAYKAISTGEVEQRRRTMRLVE